MAEKKKQKLYKSCTTEDPAVKWLLERFHKIFADSFCLQTELIKNNYQDKVC